MRTSSYLQSVIDFTPYTVKIIRDVLVDKTRNNRPIKIKIYYPEDYISGFAGAKKLPIIFWSHGLGGSADGAAFLSRHIASHGYVMVHVQHYGTDTTIWEGKKGHPWDIIRATEITRQMTLNRFGDVPYILDHLSEFLISHQSIARMADANNIGMSGHSFGALTTQILSGMLFPNIENNLTDFFDPRFKSAIAYSPGDISHLGDFDEGLAYDGIKIPLLHITGTEDKSPLTNEGYEIRLKAFEGSKDIDMKKLLVIKDADHMVFAGSRGKLGANKHREKHEEILKVFALAYWDATLKENKAAQEWLTGAGASDWLGTEGTLK